MGDRAPDQVDHDAAELPDRASLAVHRRADVICRPISRIAASRRACAGARCVGGDSHGRTTSPLVAGMTGSAATAAAAAASLLTALALCLPSAEDRWGVLRG
jgi:hypothetical protein